MRKRTWIWVETTHLEDEVLAKLKAGAKRKGLSQGKWLLMLGLEDERKTR